MPYKVQRCLSPAVSNLEIPIRASAATQPSYCSPSMRKFPCSARLEHGIFQCHPLVLDSCQTCRLVVYPRALSLSHNSVACPRLIPVLDNGYMGVGSTVS